MLTINGNGAPTPGEFSVKIAEAGGSIERNALGGAVRDVGARKRTLSLAWPHLTLAELSALMSTVDEHPYFTAAYPDPRDGETRTATFYVSQRSAGVLRMENGAPVWTDVAMEWIEK